jgi:hypothetical protein
MRISLYRTLLFGSFVFFATAGTVMAQDAGMSDVEIADDRDEENEMLLSSPGGEGEVRYIPKASSARKDSLAMQVIDPVLKQKTEPVGKPADKQPVKEDDSILTFNFLYYIIQKYKLQDIVD